jgi:CheY-like chemotaxis protein
MSNMPVIMVVEDDPDLQHLIEDALVEGGFDTEMLTSGEEALTLFQRDRTQYSALVTDINLNGTMTGWDVARQIREAVPDFPVVYMTGAAGDDWGSQGVPTSILLNKPFAPAQLVTAVSQLLNASPPTAPT